jgi:hypothetical protein
MQRTCTEAIQVTAGLARVVDNQSFEVLERRFRELYFGPMYIVELHQRKKSGTDRSDIETSMVEFGGSLDAALAAKQARPLKNLCGRALRVRQACEAHLGFTAPPEPC